MEHAKKILTEHELELVASIKGTAQMIEHESSEVRVVAGILTASDITAASLLYLRDLCYTVMPSLETNDEFNDVFEHALGQKLKQESQPIQTQSTSSNGATGSIFGLFVLIATFKGLEWLWNLIF